MNIEDDQIHQFPGDEEESVSGMVGDFDFDSMEDAGMDPLMAAAEAEAEEAIASSDARNTIDHSDKVELYSEPNLVLRAKNLRRAQAYEFPHMTFDKKKEIEIATPNSSLNRQEVFDKLFDNGNGEFCTFPFFDEFKGRLVNVDGKPFNIKSTEIEIQIAEILEAAGMKNQDPTTALKDYCRWASRRRKNSLIDNMNRNMGEWDGVNRLDTYLIDLFKPFDTPLNRMISKYFWLSLYNRIMTPGSNAPVSISLIGRQNVGKTYFSMLICRTLLGNPNAGPVQLDLSSKSQKEFIRMITGHSIVANCGELIGFNSGDMERIKEFMTRPFDELDQKFESPVDQLRQWIVILDGNRYNLQRDETGNRRFYPIFCFQKPDQNGQKQFGGEGEKVDFTHFEEDLWQVMSECRTWMEENGMDGYAALVDKVSDGVRDFSEQEMRSGSGTTTDEVIDEAIRTVLMGGDYICKTYKGNPSKNFWKMSTGYISEKVRQLTKSAPYPKSLPNYLRKYGFEVHESKPRGYAIMAYDVEGADANDMENTSALRHMIARFGVPESEQGDFDAVAKEVAMAIQKLDDTNSKF